MALHGKGGEVEVVIIEVLSEVEVGNDPGGGDAIRRRRQRREVEGGGGE